MTRVEHAMDGSAVTRRELVIGAAALFGAGSSASAVTVDDEGLGTIAARSGVTYGAAVSAKALQSDPEFARCLAQEARCLVAEGEMKWGSIEPMRGRRDYADADTIAAFARSHDVKLRGHCLVWHEAMPAWLPKALREENAADLLEAHMGDLMGRYEGQIHSWDVVNEALKPGAPDAGLRPSIWYETLGPDYIDLAFRMARQKDPAAQLVYNDFGFEHEIDWQIEKRRICLDLLGGLRKRNVPCDAFGIQAHLSATSRFDARQVSEFLKEIAAMGYRIVVTELDVDDSGAPDDPVRQDAAVADITARFLDVALSTGAVSEVLTWGLSDRHTWLNSAPYTRRKGRSAARPLPLDDKLSRKPMWTAMATQFAVHTAGPAARLR